MEGSQMPIGKYIYCTVLWKTRRHPFPVTNAYRQVHLLYPPRKGGGSCEGAVTNAYRQVHLLYPPRKGGGSCEGAVTNAYRQVHLLYDKIDSMKGEYVSQMPIGKYIYCTPRSTMTGIWRSCHKCLSASTFTVPKAPLPRITPGQRHKCLSASTFTVP